MLTEMMLLHKADLKLCRLCGKEKSQGTEVFTEKVKGAVLVSIINKYFSKEVINILASDAFSKFVCVECEQKIYTFDEFYLTVANVQKQLTAPTMEINFAEDMLRRLKENDDVAQKKPATTAKKRKSICDVCNKAFRCQAHLNRHKNIHTGARPFVCTICNATFNQQEILNKHKESHEGKKLFQCANCCQSFRCKLSLKSHLITFHADTESLMALDGQCRSALSRSLICADCGKIFTTRYKLKRHSRCHSGEKPFRCTYCDRTFSQTGNLKAHRRKCHRAAIEATESSVSFVRRIAPDTSRGISSSGDNFQNVYITESEIQKTINETINSTQQDTSYLAKSFDSPIFMHDEIETMLDQDLQRLDRNKYPSSSDGKISLCLKEPQTPELLHSLLYDV